MPVLNEILSWSKGLPDWQRDAIRRLFLTETLTAKDYDDLYAILKKDQGIPDPAGREAKIFTEDDIPTPTASETKITLQSVRNLRHVNALAEDQSLTIAETGLTVIYGDNGSGKSGYSRVLKKACRARDQSEPILPDVTKANDQTVVPTAIFDVQVDGTASELDWTDDQVSPPELSSFSVFDSRCARAYLDDEDDFAFIPYGLDIFEGLAAACRELKRRLDNEIAHLPTDKAVLSHLEGATAVGNLISSLDAKTSPSAVEALAALQEAEIAELDRISKALKEDDPRGREKHLRNLARRIQALRDGIKSQYRRMGDDAIRRLQRMQTELRSAEAAASLAARSLREGDELLPGTGGTEWRALFDSARRFAVISHPERDFPAFATGDLCPLCQEPLDDGASRLQRFEDFVKADAARALDESRSKLRAATNELEQAETSLKLDDVTIQEIASIDEALASDLITFAQGLVARRNHLLNSIEQGTIDSIPSLSFDLIGRLAKFADLLVVNADSLHAAGDAQKRDEISKRYNELEARQRLAEAKDSVLTVLGALKHKAALEKCLLDVRTNSISLKAADVAGTVVSKELENALNQEFKKLGVGALRVVLRSRTKSGKPLHKLVLEQADAKRPRDVLSEGEQRAIALSSFMAEVGLAGDSGGIILDDPVSSLDHRRRDRVARRLAEEATNRQVIVFTHDIYFLCLLEESASKVGVPILTQSVTRRPEGYGVPTSELPFQGMRTAKRVAALRNAQQRIDKLFRTGDEEAYRKETIECYQQLRLAWERAVEEVLFGEVVLRFRKGVETQRLRSVEVVDEDYVRVQKAMAKCSNYAHDSAVLAAASVPQPDELREDIEELENWRAGIVGRGKVVQKRRAN